MKKFFFSDLYDAILNRFGGVVANMLLRRLTMHAAHAEAADLAATEEQLRQFNEQGHKIAAMRLESFLQSSNDDDPSREIGVGFARQLLADDFDLADAPHELSSSVQPRAKLGRPPKRPAASS